MSSSEVAAGNRRNPRTLALAASQIREGTPLFEIDRGDNYVRVDVEGSKTAIGIDDYERLMAAADPDACAAYERGRLAAEGRLWRRYRLSRAARQRRGGCEAVVRLPEGRARSRQSHGSAARTRGSRRAVVRAGPGDDLSGGDEPGPGDGASDLELTSSRGVAA